MLSAEEIVSHPHVAALASRLRHLRACVFGPFTGARTEFAACPAVPAAIAIALGIAAVLIPVLTHFGWSGVVICAAGALALARAAPARVLSSACCVLAGAALAALHLWAPWQTYRTHLPRGECAAELRAVVVRASYEGEALPWLLPRTGPVARISALRLGPSARWSDCAGKVLLQLPLGQEAKYGERIQAKGAFLHPDPALVLGGFDYRTYLLGDGVRHVFRAENIELLGRAAGWRRIPSALYTLRDRCAEWLVAGLDASANRGVLLAMTLGYRDGLALETKQRFLRSGAVHLFAISGLHVGIVASLLLLLLNCARVPFAIRYRALPVLLGCYVFVTGGAPSAVRAWLMFSVWSLGKSAHHATTPVNTIAVAALVLLLGNPLELTRAGFQFSFFIVLILVQGWRLTADLLAVATEKRRWIPPRLRGSRVLYSAERWLWQGAGASLLAWLASCGLIAWTNQLFIPGALFVNAGLSLLAWCALFVSCLKLLVLGLGCAVADSGLAWLLDALMTGIRTLVRLGSCAPNSVRIVQPQWWLVALYSGMLLFAVAARVTARCRLAAGAGACVLLAVLLVRRPAQPAYCAVLSGGDNDLPALVLTGARGAEPMVVNSGGRAAGRAIGEWLAIHGYDAVDTLLLSAGSWGTAGGVTSIAARTTIRTLVVPPSTPRAKSLAAAQQQQQSLGRRVRRLGRTGGQSGGKRFNTAGLDVTWESSGGHRSLLLKRRSIDDSCELRITVDAAGILSIDGQVNGRPIPRYTRQAASILQLAELRRVDGEERWTLP